MGTYNRVVLVGRLGQNADVKRIGESTVANFSLATDRVWKDKTSGESQKQTDWHRISLWGRSAENIGAFLLKGREILVEGAIQTRKYKDDAGVERTIVEIRATTVVLIGSRPDDAPARKPVAALRVVDEPDDPFASDIPF